MNAYSVACLAGDGIGPEVMAQASRGMTAAARLHGFGLDEEHVPFGADATMRVGQPFPLASRNAALAADAILAATIDRTLLHSLEGGARPARRRACAPGCRGARSRSSRRSVADAWDWTLERAIATARSSRGHLTFVGERRRLDSRSSRSLGARRRPARSRSSRRRRTIRTLVSSPDSFDVVVCDSAAARPARRAAAGASTPGGCSPGAGSPKTARASSGRRTARPPTSRARASRIRARCCSLPR